MAEDKALILIPTYNEAGNISPLLHRVMAETSADVLVIDDNSPDGTQDHVRRLQKLHGARIEMLERPGKQGLAQAYIAGFNWGIARGYEKFVQMDADFSHDPSYVEGFIRALDEADVVVGSRYTKGGGTEGWSRFRKFLSQGGNTYAKTILGMRFGDLTGGFNGWRRSTLEKIHFSTVRSHGYAYQVELKYRTHRAGLKMMEIPIVFGERKTGKSKMSGKILLEAALRVFEMKRNVA